MVFLVSTQLQVAPAPGLLPPSSLPNYFEIAAARLRKEHADSPLPEITADDAQKMADPAATCLADTVAALTSNCAAPGLGKPASLHCLSGHGDAVAEHLRSLTIPLPALESAAPTPCAELAPARRHPCLAAWLAAAHSLELDEPMLPEGFWIGEEEQVGGLVFGRAWWLGVPPHTCAGLPSTP